MAIVGFSFLRFDCKRKKSVKTSGKLDVKHFMSVESVEKTDFKVGGIQNSNSLLIGFKFGVLYGEELGKVELLGEVVYTDTPEIIEETFKGYEQDKKLAQMVQREVFRFVYTRSIVKVLALATDLHLPSPIPLPKINFGGNGEGKEKQ